MSLKWISRAVLTAALMSAAACATTAVPVYDSPAADAPGADVRFLKGYDAQGAYGVSGSTGYAASSDEFCDSARQVANLTWTDPPAKVLRMRAEEPVYIWAAATYFGGQGPNYTMQASGCRNLVRFTPRAGHAYDIRQTSLYGSPSCALTITDTTTGEPAADVEIVRLAVCRQRPRAAG